MKLLIALSTFLFLASAASSFAEEIDFAKANPVLQALVDATLAGDDTVDFAMPQFDEKFSSMEKEQLKYDLKGSMKTSPWRAGSRSQMTASTSLVAVRDAAQPGVKVTLDVNFQTDVLSFLRYTGGVALSKAHGYDPEYEAREVAHLERAAAVGTLDDVYFVLKSGQDLTVDYLNHKLGQAQSFLQNLLNEGPGTRPADELAQQIADAKEWIGDWQQAFRGYTQTQITTVTTAGHISSITLSNLTADDVLFKAPIYLSIGKASLTITANSLQFSMEGFGPASLERLNELKDNLRGDLVPAQNGDPAAKDRIQKGYRQALIHFKEVINGENSY
jgi:hypothetical protein